MTEGASLVLPLGSNPSPLFSLLWALGGDGVRLDAAWIVGSHRGHAYLARALDAEWARLRAARPGAVPTRAALRLVTAGDDGHGPRATAALGQALWQAFGEATRRGGPVIAGLGGGRHRALAAQMTTTFALLARARDRLVDVRYERKELEATPAFLYPGQGLPTVQLPSGEVVAAPAMQVWADEIVVPRLRRVLPDTARPASFLGAVAIGQRTLDALAVPTLAFDLDAPAVTLDGKPVKMSHAELLLLAGYAMRRLDGEEDGWIRSDEQAALTDAAARVGRRRWLAAIPSALVQATIGKRESSSDDDAWRKLRSRARAALLRGARMSAPDHAAHFVLETIYRDGAHLTRLRTPPAALRVVGGEHADKEPTP